MANMPTEDWNPTPDATFVRRLSGLPATRKANSCPDVWELDDGNIAIVGVDVTDTYADRIPDELHIYPGDERMVVIPRSSFEKAVATFSGRDAD
jgi:hypothetical protein